MGTLKPIIWIASTKNDLLDLPAGVQDEVGHALKLKKVGKAKRQSHLRDSEARMF